MGSLFGDKRDPEQEAREAIRRKKWAKAVAHYEKRLQENERDYALWNLLGDLHMNNGARAQTLEAWRRAMEIYSLEGLYENVLGIARKILRRMPEEEDLYLLLADAYLGLEYHADCLAAFRSYLKLSKRRSEPDMRSFFRKILGSAIVHRHLLEELSAIYRESGIEDIELERQVQDYVQLGLQSAPSWSPAVAAETTEQPTEQLEPSSAVPAHDASGGLLGLETMETFTESPVPDFFGPSRPPEQRRSDGEPVIPIRSEETDDADDIPAGEGKDHYDLGMVYKEMRLWDAARAEFEEAVRDPALHTRATLALAECLQEQQDSQGALDLLEAALQNGDGSLTERLELAYRSAVIHETLGNLEEALRRLEAVYEQSATFSDVETRIAELRGKLNEGPPF